MDHQTPFLIDNIDGLNVDLNIVDEIRRLNDLTANRCVRKLLSLNKLIAKTTASKQFLLTCKTYGYVPNFIANSGNGTKTWFNDNDQIKNEFQRVTYNFHMKTLDLHLSYHSSKIKKKIYEFSQQLSRLKTCASIPPSLFKSFCKHLYDNRKTLTTTHSASKEHKLENVKRQFFYRHNLVFHDDWFLNLSDTTFPIEFKWLLSLGEKFALPIETENFPLIDMIVDIEECIHMIHTDEKEIVRARITNILSMRKNNLNVLDRTILKIHDECAIFLKHHKEIIIVKSDKGGRTVAMLRSKYEEQMSDLLSDNSTYEEHNANPLNKLSNTSNALVVRLWKEDVISFQQMENMTYHNRQLPKIYALPKIHKPDVPLRPIVASVDAPSSTLSKYIDTVLRSIVHDKYDVLNSNEVIRRISNINITRNEQLVSFDVISLFPSIPMDLVFDILLRKWADISSFTKMSQQLFFDILRFILLESTFFTYGNSIYKQINGCAMGSCISPTIANIVLNELLDTIVPRLPFKLKLLTKYVDDIFAIIPRRQVNKTLMMLNSFHPRIQFTVEIESDDRLPYLDVLLIRDNNTIVTDWYKKPMASNMTLNFLSNHPLQMRTNVAFNLFFRVLSLSDTCFHQKNTERVFNILRANNYPDRVIKTQLHRAKQKIMSNQHRTPSNTIVSPPLSTTGTSPPSLSNTTTHRRSLTYDKNTSDTIKNVLQSGSNNKIQVLAKPYRPLRKSIFSQLKSKTSMLQKTNVIYKIPCEGNNGVHCDLSYVGQTKNQLSKRLAQHRYDLTSNYDPNGQSAVVAHFTTHGHTPAFDKASILDNESHWSRRNTSECLHILCENTYNKRRDTKNISASYRALLEKYKHKKRDTQPTSTTRSSQIRHPTTTSDPHTSST